MNSQGTTALQAQPPIILRGERVRVEAEMKEGKLQERYRALRDGSWVKVAATEPARTLGPISVVTAVGATLGGAVRNVSLSGKTLVEEFTMGEHRLIRKLTVVSNGPWIHVVTRSLNSLGTSPSSG